MPLGILSSGLVGEVDSPSKVLVVLSSGMLGEATWGSAGALEVLAGGLVGQAPIETTMYWSDSFKAPAISLSSDKKTATFVSGDVGKVRGTKGRSTGKYYFEIAYGATAGYPAMGFGVAGIALDGSPPGALDTDGWSYSFGISGGGKLYHGGQVGPAISNPSANCVVSIAIDFDLGYAWIAKNGTYFFGDPVAGTDAPFTGVSGELFPVLMMSVAGESGELRLSEADFDYQPAGFTAWDSEPPAPAIIIAASLPTPVVGTAYSGTVSAANAYGATGAITLTVDALPDGLSIGTRTFSSGVYSWPIEGTPTTEETVNSTFTATNGTQSATAENEFDVQPASATPVLVQQGVGLGSASSGVSTLTLGAAPTAGNTLVMYVVSSNSNALTTPSGWTLVSDTFAGVSAGRRIIYKRTATGTEGTTISSPSMQPGSSNFAVQEWAGSVTVTAAEGGQTTAGTGSFNTGPFAAPAATAVPVVFAMFSTSSAMPPWTWPSGWTNVGPLANGSFPARGASIAYGAATASAPGTLTTTYTGTRGNGVSVYWVGAWIS